MNTIGYRGVIRVLRKRAEILNTIDRLKELEATATPGPWTFIQWAAFPEVGSVDAGGINVSHHIHNFDAEFITEMRNAWPKLLAVVDACKISRDECHRRPACQSWDNSSDCDCGYVARCNALAALEGE